MLCCDTAHSARASASAHAHTRTHAHTHAHTKTYKSSIQKLLPGSKRSTTDLTQECEAPTCVFPASLLSLWLMQMKTFMWELHLSVN